MNPPTHRPHLSRRGSIIAYVVVTVVMASTIASIAIYISQVRRPEKDALLLCDQRDLVHRDTPRPSPVPIFQ